MEDYDRKLDDLFREYRAACPDVDAGADFMPKLWQKIEARHSFWFVFQRCGKIAATACAAICLLLLALNVGFAPDYPAASTYADALAADHTAERTDYAEAIRGNTDRDYSPSAIPETR